MTEEKKAMKSAKLAERAAAKVAKQEAKRKAKLSKAIARGRKMITKAIERAEKVQGTLASELDKALVIFEHVSDSLKGAPTPSAKGKKARK